MVVIHHLTEFLAKFGGTGLHRFAVHVSPNCLQVANIFKYHSVAQYVDGKRTSCKLLNAMISALIRRLLDGVQLLI